MRVAIRSHFSMAACLIYSATLAFLLFGFVSRAMATTPGATPNSPSTANQYRNPILWEDLPDDDIFRVGNTYYYSSSTMHYSPGAPVLRSYDLVHWEYVGHSVPVLDFSPAYDLKGGNAYVKGIWASFLGYRKSNKTFYWGGCIEFSKTYIYTATNVAGPWKKRAVLPQCYYDAGLLIDDDNTMYVAYGNTTLHVAQLSPDGFSQVRSKPVFTAPSNIGALEGSRFYKVNGNYYIFTDHPPDAEYVLKSTTGPFGPYTIRPLEVQAIPPVPGAGAPHQGGIVQTQNGDWYYMAFIDAFPGGRIPVLAPIKWNADGWPVLQIASNTWGISYPYPLPPHPVQPLTSVDYFRGTTLGPQWEWNHNPDNTKWSLRHGLTLKTATVTDDFYAAGNTLTHRILGPASTATIVLNYSHMKNGDRAGLAMFRDSSAWVGIKREGHSFKVVMEDNIKMNKKWQTTSTGTEVAKAPVSGRRIWLRVSADIRPGVGRTAKFSYSTDGRDFISIGKPFVLDHDWQYFMGYRYAIFNYATQSLGGEVKIASYSMKQP